MGRKFWRSVGVFASIVAGVGVAGAADLAVKAPVYKAALVILSDWSGFYIGVHGGYGWGHSSIDTPDFPYLDQKKNASLQLASFNASPKGAVFGGHAGYNWQYGSVVTGLELDFSGADIKTAGVVGTFWDYCRAAYGDISRSVKFDELATARARLGYVVLPNLLAYGTAGAAWGHSEMTGSVQYFGSGTAGTNNFGWVAGGGLEHKLWEHVLVRVEYLHYDFARTTYVTPIFTTTAATSLDVVRAGLSYKF
jgi:opacity protein-like surface antigen